MKKHIGASSSLQCLFFIRKSY